MAFLESSQANIVRIYVRAVVAYALALADSPQKLQANQDLLNVAIYDAGMFILALFLTFFVIHQ